MGAWGTKLYDNDVALDVKGIYKDKYNKSKDGVTLTKEVFSECSDFLTDIEDGPIVFLALADLQMKDKILIEDVKNGALKAMIVDLENWKGNEEDYKARKKELDKLKVKLENYDL